MFVRGMRKENMVYLFVFVICGLEGREKEDVGYGVRCFEFWGNLMLGWEREEGRILGFVEGFNSFYLWDLWNLIYLVGRGSWSRKM